MSLAKPPEHPGIVPIAGAPVRPGLVSVIVVNYRGATDTIECIKGLRELDWPADQLQIVVVDNASGDGSADRIAAAAPDVKLVRATENTGFAGGCNLGAANADGEFIALINNDARPHPRWLVAAVDVLREEATVGAIASKVLDWDGERIDFVGGNINFAGQGYRTEAGVRVDGKSYASPRNVLYFTGSAAVVRTEVFRALGGFDEQFFMFFEDVDFGWRMNLRGHQVRYLPGSIVYHKHHASIAKFGSFREQYLLARNSLMTIYKNFGDETLQRALAPALMLAIRDSVLQGGDDADILDLERTSGGDDQDRADVAKSTMVATYAINFLARNLAEIDAKRQTVQDARVCTDESMVHLFGDILRRTSPAPEYADTWDAVLEAFDLEDLLPRPLRVVVITADTLSPQMAGPAIRAFHIARALAAEHHVRLVSTTMCALDPVEFDCVQADDRQLRLLVEWSDVVIFQGFVMHEAPWIAETDKVIIVDIYDPIHLEQLEQSKADEPINRRASIVATTGALNDQLKRGDFFLCASEEQRHFWLGQLAGVGRLNPKNYDRDSSLRNLLAVSPFGLSELPPRQNRSAIKGAIDGIGHDDKVILWGGGVYNWFDPLTLIQAVDKLRADHDDVRLFFLGMKHPNPNVPEMRMAWEARQLSDHLGLTDKYVFFNEQWVVYNDRVNYLMDADLGVSAHFLHVETTFSFRTRMLDYLWAGIPIVATDGDSFGRLIRSEGLGIVVPERDSDAMAAALERALYDEEFVAECRKNVARVREQFTWQRTLEPLVEFCRRPLRAEDVEGERRPRRGRDDKPAGAGLSLARNLEYARAHYREGGMPLVLGAAKAKLRRLVSR
jgi:GT2 family glycosyltransferase/glycosyltransferase involved in cell wall biosynthesis